MNARFLAGAAVLALLVVASADAGQRNPVPPAPPAAPAAPGVIRTPTPPQPPAPPKKVGQPINLRTEFTITDQRPGSPPEKRTVTLVVADAEGGSIRSAPEAFEVPRGLQLNVDVHPEILTGNKIRLGFTLQYDGAATVDGTPARGTTTKTTLRESLSLIMEDGKALTVAQSADPNTDRTVTLDVKVTIMR